jgi:phosphoribosylanthranilate isomerase
VGEAIALVSPYAVDTASGTEGEPGRKDPDKLTAFFRAVEAADPAVVVHEAGGPDRGGVSD